MAENNVYDWAILATNAPSARGVENAFRDCVEAIFRAYQYFGIEPDSAEFFSHAALRLLYQEWLGRQLLGLDLEAWADAYAVCERCANNWRLDAGGSIARKE